MRYSGVGTILFSEENDMGKTVGVIGLGNMGSAILSALMDEKEYTLAAYDMDEEKRNAFSSVSTSSLENLVSSSDLIIIAVKPNVIDSAFLASIKKENAQYISIAAGVDLAKLEKGLGSRNIARYMPNIAAKKKKAVTAICFSASADDEFKKDAKKIGKSFGSEYELKEREMNAFTAISGSFIAYALAFFDSAAYGGTYVGIPYPVSLEIARKTTESAIALLEDGEAPGALIPSVCSAGGTTIEGMKTLFDTGFQSALINAIIATCQKAEDMEKKEK